MEDLLKFLAQLADCLGQHYYDKSQAIEILQKSNIDFLAIDINGSTRDIWWNIIQYISSHDPSTMNKLINISIEDNPESSCLVNLNNPLESFNKSKSKTNSIKDLLSRNIDKSDFDGVVSKGIEIVGEFLEDKTIFQNGFTPDSLNNDQAYFISTVTNSFAVGLIENKLDKSFSTGFLISSDLVVMPTFVITDPSEVEYLKFQLHDAFQKKFSEYSFEQKPYLVDNEFMILKLVSSVPGIKPLKIATERDLNNLDEKIFSLISFPKLNKSITTISNLKLLNNKEFHYQTASAQGSAGGAILMDDLLIGMHIGKIDDQKRGANLIFLNNFIKS